MINSNNLQVHLNWLKSASPQVPDPHLVSLALKKYEKSSTNGPDQQFQSRQISVPDSIPSSYSPPIKSHTTISNEVPRSRKESQSHISQSISTFGDEDDDDIIDLTADFIKPKPANNFVQPKTQSKTTKIGSKEQEFAVPRTVNVLDSLQPQESAFFPNSNVPSKSVRTPSRLESSVNLSQQHSALNSALNTLISLQDTKIALYEQRFQVSESTSLSLDSKLKFYKNEFDPSLASIDKEIAAVRAKAASLSASNTHIGNTSTQIGNTSIPQYSEKIEEDTFEFSDDDDEAIITAAANPIASIPRARSSSPAIIPNNSVFKVPETPNAPIDLDMEEVQVRNRASEARSRAEPRNIVPEADVSVEEDHFGDRTMDGLLTPTQERNDEDDLGSFIDDNTALSDDGSYTSSHSDSQNYAVKVDGNELEDIRLSPDVAEQYGIKYSQTSDNNLLDDHISTQKDEGSIDVKTEQIEEIDENVEENDDEIEEIEDFTTQLNEERELNDDVIIEISDEEETYFNENNQKNPENEPKNESSPNGKVTELFIESDMEFSDDDDHELMDILNNHKEIRSFQDSGSPSVEQEPAPQGSEAFIGEIYQVLNSIFKLSSFRPNQLEAISSSLQGKDVFVLMPTGGGKSLCYQLPALIQGGKTKGTTVVISPLISLMQDQVQHLLKLNVKAGMISSKANTEDNKQTLNLFRDGFLQIVYLSPEKANKSSMVQRIIGKLYDNNQLARVVIDEAHCLSSWGHDFRPDYQGMSFFKQQYPKVPLMALTATANEKVRMDIIHHLKMTQPVLLKQSFNRSNLFYEIKWKSANYVEWIRDYIAQNHNGKTGIIYCHSKQSCEQTSAKLSSFGLKTSFYHAGMSPQDRFTVQNMWQTGKLQLICATIAFGMGIDKPDVRFVIHLFIPRSLEGYYQETGRAGRDGLNSDCIMFYSYKDARQLQNMIHRDEELTPEGKENHLAKLRQVVQYCENTTDCRRKQVLHYFNESFNPAECKKRCDNCLNSSSITTVEKNCTQYAKDIIQLVQSIQDDQVTVLHCQDVFKGSNYNKIIKMGHNNNPFHGRGKNLDKTDVERIFFYLLSEECLVEYQVMKGGFASNYVRVGKLGPKVLRGEKIIRINFSSKASSETTTSKGPALTSRAGPALTSRGPVGAAPNLNGFRYQESFVTARQMSNGDLNSYGSSNIINLPANQFGAQVESHQHKAHIEHCYRELNKARIEISSELGIPINQFITGITLTDMSIKLPTNKREFAKLSEIRKDQLDHFNYLKKLLGTLARERKKGGATQTQQTHTQITQVSQNNPVGSNQFNVSQQDMAIVNNLRNTMPSGNTLPVATSDGYKRKRSYKPKSQRPKKRPSQGPMVRAMPM